nr:MAG TPA: Microtubule integrity protein [Bacteriophage sp.]
MVHKQIQTRDYLRSFVTRVNKEAGVTFNASKLNSKEECEKYILNLIKDLKNNSGNNKAYIKEINELKEEIEILNAGNKRLESERAFYITQAEGAKKAREIEQYYRKFNKNMADKWETAYKFQEGKNKIIRDFNIFLSFVIVLEALSIVMLLWK